MDQKLDELYKLYDELGKAEKEGEIAEKSAAYEAIIARATTGETQEKRLVSQFIAKFFKHFPDLELKAVEAQIELCDDADINVRKQAIHDLPSFCSKGHDDPYISRIAIVLCQLLTVDEKGELSIVEKSLSSLLRQSIHATVKGIFAQMTSTICDDPIRDACVRFLCGKVNLKNLERDSETMILQEATKVAPLISGEEFILLIKLLSGLKISKLVANQQIILDLIADQLQITANPVFDEEHTLKLKACLPLALPFFTPFAPSRVYIQHFATGFLPACDLQAPEILDLLKLFAQISQHSVRTVDKDDAAIEQSMQSVLTTLLGKIQELLPVVPADEDLEKDPELPPLHLSHLECLLIVFHNIARFLKPSMIDDEAALKTLRQRLQYLNRGLQAENKKLKALLDQGVKVEAEKRVTIQLALKTISNLTTFMRDWFHNPPTFKTNVTPSWLQELTNAKGANANNSNGANHTGTTKRKAIVFERDEKAIPPKKQPIAGGAAATRGRPNRQLYQPPRGDASTGRFRSGRW